MATTKHAPIVEELISLIAKNNWQSKFEQALKACEGRLRRVAGQQSEMDTRRES